MSAPQSSTADRLEEALARMTPRQRATFLAIRIDGLTYPEIAARTGLSIRRVEREFTAGLLILFRTMDELASAHCKPPLRRRMVAWLRR
ncbi:RNA polymerase subunit sigma [Sphingomonas sp. AP4-R1]|uniref:sigma-70 region 4 domain-containing protein n=1 Tax=Sphingomonas sp. AP4-R1 TaxID=2735134 RepID=UPI001493C8DB|nr:RNA polymerase subunit sigma [Sphingomonas sp. AP4-R1]